MDSILVSIKKLLDIPKDYTEFDTNVIMHINSVFADLTQMGVGPKEGFSIEDDVTIWTDYIEDITKLQAVKSYIFLRVKLLFDSNSMGSATLAAYERQIQQWEWRLTLAAESPDTI